MTWGGEDLAVRTRPSIGSTVEWVVRAELLVPAGGAATVQVLLPGLTYDRRYWQGPGGDSYAGVMLRGRYAGLPPGPGGTRASSPPPAPEGTRDSQLRG